MKIHSTAVGLLKSPLLRPFKTALRTVTELEEITVQVVDQNGRVGWGSVVPTPAITGDTDERIQADLKILLSELRRKNINDIWSWQEEISAAAGCSRSAVCAIDVALHDLAAKTVGQPLWKWLGGMHSIRMTTNMTISVDTPEVMARCSADAVAAGFTSLKVKVGLNAELDKTRVMAIRNAIGSKISLRLDANQGWSEKEALALIPWFVDMCGPIDFIEQPVVGADLDAMVNIVQASPVPVVADESAMTFAQAREVLDRGAANALSVKLIKAGGVAEARRILDLAFERKVPCLMSCMFEVGAGLQASAQLACMHPSVHWVDLDSAEFLASLPYEGGVRFSGPRITVGDEPGLGIDLGKSLRPN
jgi:L-alanine-DL-glutamate epimerase-like enolase superfamily enzyme